MSEQGSPWRFLTALDGSSPADRKLLELTRQEELRIVINMVASSGVSLLYAFSGNGKTSLINAGVVPHFIDRDYAVFTTRPRPPYSVLTPVDAFKDSVLQNFRLPLFGPDDTDLLERLRTYIGIYSPEEEAELREDLLRLEDKIRSVKEVTPDVSDLRQRLQEHQGKSISEFIKEIRQELTPQTRMLFVCDQFEELFVHYGNTPQMNEFIKQLGEVWADDSLESHLLFSMREDSVGSMIAFRRAIPDIFVNYFKLDPIRQSRAKEALVEPLASIGLQFSDDAIQAILKDLVSSYQESQTGRFSGVKLTPSPEDDRFIELPALQIVTDELWETRQAQTEPFGLDHYNALGADFPTTPQEDLEPSLQGVSPAQAVLDSYILSSLEEITDDQGFSSEIWRELRLDSLFLLTDEVSHRRARTEDDMLSALKQVRPNGLDLPDVDLRMLQQALLPMISIRLVREAEIVGGGSQYELVHDFAVRTVVRDWRLLDRRRTEELAVRNQQRTAAEERLVDLTRRERWTQKFLTLMSISGISYFSIATLGSLFVEYGDIETWSWLWGLILPPLLILVVGTLNWHKVSINRR